MRGWAWAVLAGLALAGCGDEDQDGVQAPRDCDDTDPRVSPEAFEIPYDGVDNDCDPGSRDDDLDGDGLGRAEDCNDGDPAVAPDAPERCNGADDDCDGVRDEDATAAGWFPDADGDGFGDPDAGPAACDGASGLVADDTDCDDADDGVFPGATETCDGVDQDCDGEIDDGGTDPRPWYLDGDGDGHGDASDPVTACTPPADRVDLGDDCDDADPAVFPGAPEVCDPADVDEDCDGAADDADPTVDPATFPDGFLDADGDGFGAGAPVPSSACALGFGLVPDGTDCSDYDPRRNPGAPEDCNLLDDDCDGQVDEGTTLSTWWFDADGDGFGGILPIAACVAPPYSVAVGGDCDETRATVFPGAPEVCDGLDSDCDGAGDPTTRWYADVDGDGHGDPLAPVDAPCTRPPGVSATDDDCDDADALRFPGAPERCDGVDDDCDGVEDDGAAARTWYPDADGDRFGDDALAESTCDPLPGAVVDGGDCDDADPFRFPGAPEVCDGLDQDCDAVADDDAVDVPWYRDDDADGFGLDTDVVSACAPPAGRARARGDCADTDADRHPGAPEVCDFVDQDCDGFADEDAPPQRVWLDGDGDGFGDPYRPSWACAPAPPFVDNDDDCSDFLVDHAPGAPEVCNGSDDDCDGLVDEDAPPGLWWADADGDGLGDAARPQRACAAPAGTVATPGDCDDRNPAVGPPGPDLCDGVDGDCDGLVDEDEPGSLAWADTDGDGFGDLRSPLRVCGPTPGYVADATDRDDTRADFFPGAADACDGLDGDGDGVVDEDDPPALWYYDGDGDGLGAASGYLACQSPGAGYVLTTGDCDDGNAARGRGFVEVCDDVDNDCDSVVDDGVSPPVWYADADGDGFGGAQRQTSCVQPFGWAAETGDCNDGAPDVFPGAVEVCDGADQDCDGAPDDGALATPWYQDLDGDGFGGAFLQAACAAPAGAVANHTDCDEATAGRNCGAIAFLDADGDGAGSWSSPVAAGTPGSVGNHDDCDDGSALVGPGVAEVCDGLDQDCDGVADDGAWPTRWYYDGDGDGFGSFASPYLACAAPAAYVADGTDCHDGRAAANPGVPTDACDGYDDDCDGVVDDDDPPPVWYYDGDGDGLGSAASPYWSCSAPAAYVATAGDCDDARAQSGPGMPDACDGYDNDCDRIVDEADPPTAWWYDGDADGVGSPYSPYVSCAQPASYVAVAGDCVDYDPAVRPGLPDTCDRRDTDCDGLVDEDDPPIAGFADADGDGGGAQAARVVTCDPAAVAPAPDDCRDYDPAYAPGLPDPCDGVDTDCDGLVDEDAPIGAAYRDVDGDGIGGTRTFGCLLPGEVAVGGDCVDSDPAAYPGAPADPCDGVDSDCDGLVDDVPPTWFFDGDGDGWGSLPAYALCAAPVGFVRVSGDCADDAFSTSPGSVEICGDAIDDDCDGAVDEGCP